MVDVAITVRRVKAGEGQRLRDVRLAALADAPSAFASSLDTEAIRPLHVWDERAIRSACGRDAVTFLAVAPDDCVVGLVTGLRDVESPATVELVSMWIAPEVRRQGAARALVGAVFLWAGEVRATAVGLWVTRGNEPAKLLYESLGFVETGDYQALPSDPCKDEVRMARAVRPTG